MSLPKLSLPEIFLAELMIWFVLWLWNDYIAALLTSIIGAIVFAVLLIALISEWLERSKVPRRYFGVMFVSLLAPAVAALLYIGMNGGLDFIPDAK